MYHHGPPGIVGSTEGDALEKSADSSGHQHARFMSFYDDRKRGRYAEPESPSKRSDDDGGFPTIDELLAGRKRSRSSEPEPSHNPLSKRQRKHKKGDFDRSAVITVSPSENEPGSPDNPIDVDEGAAPGSPENPLVDAGDGAAPEIGNSDDFDVSQSSTEVDSPHTVLQEQPADTQQPQPHAVARNTSVFDRVDSTDSNKENAEPTSPTSTSFGNLAGSSDEASTDDGGREHNDPSLSVMLSSDGSSASLASLARGNIQPAITTTVLGRTPEGGTSSLVMNHAHDSGSASTTDRSASDIIRDYGISGHQWVNRELQLSVLQEMWVSADVLERDYPCLVRGYKQDRKITALRQSPRLKQQRS
ncbi:hypothetical protein FQN54_006407 [Arachnomyces sp. PD_36]|nr:hypothetical protein FQN54_006407 [Arachnomyces sp. PD_36]